MEAVRNIILAFRRSPLRRYSSRRTTFNQSFGDTQGFLYNDDGAMGWTCNRGGGVSSAGQFVPLGATKGSLQIHCPADRELLAGGFLAAFADT